MAPSKRMLLISLLAFALIAATLQPSVASKVHLKAKEASSQPLFWHPRLPHRPPTRCIPAGLPRHPFLSPCPTPPSPTSAPAPQPSECYTPLSGMMPCADFLTNKASVRAAPPSVCCDGLKAVVKDAPICLCHVFNHGFSKMLPGPILHLRMMALPRMCRVAFLRATLGNCIKRPVPPMTPPAPAPAATPPESPSSPPPEATPPESPPSSPPPAATPPESPPSTPATAATPPESPSTPPASPSAPPPAATPPATPSTPPVPAATPPESPSTPPPTPAAAPTKSPSTPSTLATTPPESPSVPPPTPAAKPPAST